MATDTTGSRLQWATGPWGKQGLLCCCAHACSPPARVQGQVQAAQHEQGMSAEQDRMCPAWPPDGCLPHVCAGPAASRFACSLLARAHTKHTAAVVHCVGCVGVMRTKQETVLSAHDTATRVELWAQYPGQALISTLMPPSCRSAQRDTRAHTEPTCFSLALTSLCTFHSQMTPSRLLRTAAASGALVIFMKCDLQTTCAQQSQQACQLVLQSAAHTPSMHASAPHAKVGTARRR